MGRAYGNMRARKIYFTARCLTFQRVMHGLNGALGGRVLRQRQTLSEVKRDLTHDTDTSLHGGILVLARISWVVVVVLVLGLSFASIPTYFASLHHLLNSAFPPDLGGQLTSSTGVQDLQAVSLSLDFYAKYNVLLTLIFLFVSLAVGTVIFW